MRVILGDDAAVAQWCGQHLEQIIVPPYVAIGFSRTGAKLDGAAVFNNYSGANIEVTIYGPGCMTRGALRVGFDYAFNGTSALRLSMRTKRSNRLMRRLAHKLGFIYEGTCKNFFGPARGDDALLFVMFKPQAEKWL